MTLLADVKAAYSRVVFNAERQLFGKRQDILYGKISFVSSSNALSIW